MKELNIELLKENISTLMSKKGFTQVDFAEKIGMSQPNLSKALNKGNKQCFTVDQLFRISQVLEASIDNLAGNDTSDKTFTDPKSVFNYICYMLKHNCIKAKLIETEEYVLKHYFDENGFDDTKACNIKIKYPAFYFPNHFDPQEEEPGASSEEILSHYAYTYGNESAYIHMNEILKKFIPIAQLYLKGQIKDESFDIIVNGFLSEFDK